MDLAWGLWKALAQGHPRAQLPRQQAKESHEVLGLYLKCFQLYLKNIIRLLRLNKQPVSVY